MLRIEVPVAEAEVVADALWTAGASAVGVEERGGAVVLTADLDVCPPDMARWPHEVGVDDGAWWDGWRRFARAVVAGPFLVRPPWVGTEVPAGAIELVVDAGRSFGTGVHPSTTLALRALARLVTPGTSVLDAGCGSGTLAIGAALLAARVLAIDVDPEAIAATRANVYRNAVVEAVEVAPASVEVVAGAFDVVIANLGAPLVYDLAGALAARCTLDGTLVLSGMFGAGHRDRVIAAYPKAELLEFDEEDGWTCAVLRAVGQPSGIASHH